MASIDYQLICRKDTKKNTSTQKNERIIDFLMFFDL